MLRARAMACALLLLSGTATFAADPPETIGGHDELWWGAEARARERELERSEQALAECEEREAPVAYRSVPGQVFRGRDGFRYSEVVRCDALRESLEAARAEQDAFEERARRLGVPPGWLR
jgi:hypothetical protein